ncbi:uncharacterized protein V6R79_020952 [Siganus canaliculatus]
METKVWAALCALLLVNLGSADHDIVHSTSSSSSKMVHSEATPTGPAAESVPVSNPDPVTHVVTAPSLSSADSSSSPGVTSSLSNSSTTEAESIPQTPAPRKDNGTSSTSPPEVASPHTDPAVQLTSQPPVSPSGSHIPPDPTIISPPHTPHTTVSVDATTTTTTTTTQSAHTTHHVTSPPLDGGTPSNQSSHPPQDVITSTAATELPKLETSASTVARSTSAPSISPVSSTHVETSQPDKQHETSSAPHPKSSTAPPSSPSVQAKTHANTPSQLNVGGDTKMVHEPHTLNPLLAGLVSAFIVMAVIITLVLFLKLRRRNNRPEFRRLQDLPMDDMMEDTPLSMYTY